MAVFIERGTFNELLAAGTPLINGVTPPSGTHGTTATVTITGVNTNFAQGTTQVLVAGNGVTVSSVTVANATSLTARLTIAAGADLTPRSLIVTTGSEEAVAPNLFTVQ